MRPSDRDFPDDVLLVMDEAYLEYLDDPADLLPEIRAGQRLNLILPARSRKSTASPASASAMASVTRNHRRPREDPRTFQRQYRRPGRRPGRARRRFPHVPHPAVNRQGLQQLQTGFAKLGLVRSRRPPTSSSSTSTTVSASSNQMQKQGVIVRPMGGYQLPEWIRVSVGTPPKTTAASTPCAMACLLSTPVRAVESARTSTYPVQPSTTLNDLT
jgi:histidinol-phosphate aminotransferase